MLHKTHIINPTAWKWCRHILLILVMALTFVSCTGDEKEIPPPGIFLGDANDLAIEIEVGDTVTIEPKITYNYESSYEWRINGEPIEYDGLNLEVVALALGRTEYFFKVNTPSGADSVIIPVDVMVMVDLQDLEVPENNYWTVTADENGFTNNGVLFPAEIVSDTTWQGFGYSRLFNKTADDPLADYSAYSMGREEEIFALVRQPAETAPPTFAFTDGQNHRIKTLEIANTNQGYQLMKFGTNELERMGGPSGTTPDWCRVVITGLDTEGAKTGEKVFYLGDFRFENNKRDYIIDDWQTINLTELGAVNQLQFKIEVSRSTDMVRPEIFCIDNLKVLD